MSQFETDTLLTITAQTNYAGLGSATVKKIMFEKPSGSKGFWLGTLAGTALTYNVQAGDIDQPGLWFFQTYIEVAGQGIHGDKATIYFEEPIL